jgi:hypothetical protein
MISYRPPYRSNINIIWQSSTDNPLKDEKTCNLILNAGPPILLIYNKYPWKKWMLHFSDSNNINGLKDSDL